MVKINPAAAIMDTWKRLSPGAQQWIAVFAAWTLFGLANCIAAMEMSGKGFNPVEFAYEILFWYTMALGTPAVFRLAERFPIERGRLVSRILLHFGAAVVYTLVYGVVRTLFDAVHPTHILGSDPDAPFWTNYMALLARALRIVHFDYWALLGIGHALPPGRFFRIHRSSLVNLQRVRELRSNRHGESHLLLCSGITLKVSRNRRGPLQEALTTASAAVQAH